MSRCMSTVGIYSLARACECEAPVVVVVAASGLASSCTTLTDYYRTSPETRALAIQNCLLSQPGTNVRTSVAPKINCLKSVIGGDVSVDTRCGHEGEANVETGASTAKTLPTDSYSQDGEMKIYLLK